MAVEIKITKISIQKPLENINISLLGTSYLLKLNSHEMP